MTSCDIVEVKHKARGYEALSATGETYFGDKLIIACGGAAGKKLGGSKSGYHLLEQLGHGTTALFPSLTQIKTDPTYVKALKGVRADAHVRLRKDDETLQDSFGEVQFTDFGLSGPEAFTLARGSDRRRGTGACAGLLPGVRRQCAFGHAAGKTRKASLSLQWRTCSRVCSSRGSAE